MCKNILENTNYMIDKINNNNDILNSIESKINYIIYKPTPPSPPSYPPSPYNPPDPPYYPSPSFPEHYNNFYDDNIYIKILGIILIVCIIVNVSNLKYLFNCRKKKILC
tara:strand:+ start:206 stop:532 length:327 start_codon:yes stop_codon:yes gene_type:complete